MNIKAKLNKIYDAKIVCRKLNKKWSKSPELEKKILLIGHNSDKQGAAVLLEYIAAECVRQGWQVEILVRNPGDMIQRYSKICKTTCFVGKRDFKRIVRNRNKKGFRNAICNTTVNGDLVEILKNMGFKVETLVHELPQAIKKLKIEDRACKIGLLSDRVVFPSTFVYEKFKEFSDVKNVLIKPQGLYLTDKYESNYKQSYQELNEELNIKGKKIVINVATGEMRKGFDIFLQVAKNLKEEKDILFIWIGSINKQIYEKVIENEKLDNLITYGYVDDVKKLMQFYDCANILLLTSREEPFGSIVLEAFHSGTPVIGFENAGGFVDTVIPGETGELVEYENVDKLQTKLLELLNESDVLAKYSDNCKKFAEKFKFDKYVEKITEIFYE